MKNLRKMKRPIAAAVLSLSLFQFSVQNAVAVGSYQQAPTYASMQSHQDMAFGWAAIAAGVAVVGAAVGAVVGAYEIGTIVGHAAHDLLGRSNDMASNYERASYVAGDFSQFDNASHN